MGYCPYYCIKCKTINDNGWRNETYTPEEAGRLTGGVSDNWKFRMILKSNDNMTLSICASCVEYYIFNKSK